MNTYTRAQVKMALRGCLDSVDEDMPEDGLVTPMNQTIQVGESAFLQVVILEADQDIFDRIEHDPSSSV